MVRLKDSAALCKVSVMTVSKALRDEPDVSEATRAKIKALAAQGLGDGHHGNLAERGNVFEANHF